MKYQTAKDVRDIITASDEVERKRGKNRSKINDMINGVPPMAEEEAEENHLKVNCNFGEMAVLVSHARRQYSNAFLRTSRFFKVSIPNAPQEYKNDWETFITTFINRKLKQSRSYFHLLQYKFSSLVAHGIAPQMWYDRSSWLPKFVAVEDMRVPTDTETSFDRLEWFAVRHYYTEGELGDAVFSKNSDAAWNKPAVSKILAAYHPKSYENQSYDWFQNPEKAAELLKQNLGYFTSDAVPTIPLWKFYFKDRDKGRKPLWKLCVVPDTGVEGVEDSDVQFLAQKETWATDLSQILHVQFGDLNNKAPHMYHSVRSLGFLLMEPCFWSNLLVCRNLQHVFESFNIWLRIADPVGQQRAQKVEMYDQCVIPQGVSVVPQSERHQIDPKLVEAARANMRQLMAEAAASYVQSTDSGTSREQTAYETAVKMSQVNAMMSGLLIVAFFQEAFAYREICRRFCLRTKPDDDAKEFQQEASRHRIPQTYLNVKYWDITPEIPLGAGNPTMEMAQVGQLMANREKFNPSAQQEILHDFALATTNDPGKAQRLAPLEDKFNVSNATRDAEAMFGALMQGVPVHDRVELNPIDQIEALLGMLGAAIGPILRSSSMATPQQVQGFSAVAQHVRKLLSRLASNELERQRVKVYGDQLGNIENEIKAFAERLQEQGAQLMQQQGNAEAAQLQAKLQSQVVQAQTKAQIAQEKAAQSAAHKQQQFESEEQRKDFANVQEQARQNALNEVEVKSAEELAAVQKKAAASKPKSE